MTKEGEEDSTHAHKGQVEAWWKVSQKSLLTHG
jgi:hypothetical protein